MSGNPLMAVIEPHGDEPRRIDDRNNDRGDGELIAGARAGSEAMFACLLERYRPLIWGLAWRLTLNAEDARDVSQQVVLRIWRGLPDYRVDENFAGWLRTIAVREGLRWLKREGRRRRRVVSIEDLATPPQPVDSSAGGLEWLLAGERRRRIETALGILSPQQRAAITLRYFEEMDLGQIARSMDCSTGSVKQHLFRALGKLRRAMKKDKE